MIYVKTSTPEEFMELNFIKKLKEKPEPIKPRDKFRDITPFDWDPKIKNNDLTLTWNQELFYAKNPGLEGI